jgi:cytochrome bd-type quinol oxidase subunit 2
MGFWFQLVTFGLDEFDREWDRFANLPEKYGVRIQDTFAFRHGWVISIISKIDYYLVVFSCLFLVFVGLAWFYPNTSERLRARINEFAGLEVLFLVIVAGGVFSNALICGALSTVHNHYQARVVWLIPVMAMLVLVRIRMTPEEIDKKSSSQLLAT